MTRTDLNTLMHDYRWETMEGEVLTLDQMKTPHVFNAMKCLYNPLAQLYGIPTVWYVQKHPGKRFEALTNPKLMARYIMAFIFIIETRGDLPAKYLQPYNLIVNYLRGVFPKMVEDTKRITDERIDADANNAEHTRTQFREVHKAEDEESQDDPSDALSWDDLANEYDKTHGGRRARTLPMDKIADWAERYDGFKVVGDYFFRKEARKLMEDIL